MGLGEKQGLTSTFPNPLLRDLSFPISAFLVLSNTSPPACIFLFPSFILLFVKVTTTSNAGTALLQNAAWH